MRPLVPVVELEVFLCRQSLSRFVSHDDGIARIPVYDANDFSGPSLKSEGGGNKQKGKAEK